MIRKAKIAEAKTIQKLINSFAKEGKLLPRSLSEIYDNLRDFFVFEEDGRILGVCALHICWEDLAEIRSLAVQEDAGRKGVGRQLVEACLEEAKELGVKKVFLLTYIPSFFRKLGFSEVDKATLPHKIWGDCLRCPKFPHCDEVALLKTLEG
ncbi:MAG: N-acetyltransferase [Deltaproteobacteria bacterium]|nr:MAG: N-acetyltransferase [Deltaproteobacteria bacterium]